jgi:hypothetical protein
LPKRGVIPVLNRKPYGKKVYLSEGDTLEPDLPLQFFPEMQQHYFIPKTAWH